MSQKGLYSTYAVRLEPVIMCFDWELREDSDRLELYADTVILHHGLTSEPEGYRLRECRNEDGSYGGMVASIFLPEGMLELGDNRVFYDQVFVVRSIFEKGQSILAEAAS